jgi:predicted membrane protein
MSHDLRKYQRQTTIRLIIGGILLLYIVGGGLIYLIYGRNAALSGIFCLLLGMIPLAAIMLFFLVIEWIVKRYRDE